VKIQKIKSAKHFVVKNILYMVNINLLRLEEKFQNQTKECMQEAFVKHYYYPNNSFVKQLNEFI